MDKTRKPDTHAIVNGAALTQENKQLLGGLIREGRLNAAQAKALATMGQGNERGQWAASVALHRINQGRDVQGMFGQTSRPVTSAEFRQYMNSAITDANVMKNAAAKLGRYNENAPAQQQRKTPQAKASVVAPRMGLDLRAP